MHVLGSGIVSNVDVKRRDLIKRTLGKPQGDPSPQSHSRRVTEMLFTRARGLPAGRMRPGTKGRGGGGRGVGWAGAGEELLALEMLCLQESCPPKTALVGSWLLCAMLLGRLPARQIAC